MTAEGNTIVQSVQAYNTHQQQLNTELSRCANYDVAQTQQQYNALTQLIHNMQATMNASKSLRALALLRDLY